MPRPKRTGLTEKEERFCREWVATLRPTQVEVAVRAGYNAGPSIHSQASAIYKRPDIQARIAELRQKNFDRIEIKTADIDRLLWDMITADPLDFFNDDGTLKSLKEIKKTSRLAIKSLRVTKVQNAGLVIGENIEIKWEDKIKAIELLMRRFGLLKDKLEHSGVLGLAERLEKALKK